MLGYFWPWLCCTSWLLLFLAFSDHTHSECECLRSTCRCSELLFYSAECYSTAPALQCPGLWAAPVLWHIQSRTNAWGPRIINVGLPGPGTRRQSWRRAWRDKVGSGFLAGCQLIMSHVSSGLVACHPACCKARGACCCKGRACCITRGAVARDSQLPAVDDAPLGG